MAPTADSTSSTSKAKKDPAAAPDGVPLGRVVGAHGLRGELRIRVSGDDLANLESVPRVRLVREQGEPETSEYEVERSRPGRSGECRMALRGVTDRDAAEALRGRLVLVRPGDLPLLPPGEFYAFQLVGCQVRGPGGAALGTVRGVLDNGAQSLLRVEDAAGVEHLVPAVPPLLREVDVAARRIVIDPPPGLLAGDGPADSTRD